MTRETNPPPGDPAASARREAEVYRQLRDVVDPELGLDIVRLGLVYDVAVRDGEVGITMTFTSQGCPLGPAIEGGVRHVVDALEWVKATNIRIVWSPSWNPGMIERDQE